MSKSHTVAAGECMASIAYRYGHLPETLWDHPDNEALRELRGQLSVLREGDVVVIPDKQVTPLTLGLDQKHRFRRKRVPETLQLQLLLGNEPRADEAYTLEVDGVVVTAEGVTDDQGRLEDPISPAARVAVVRLIETREEYVFALGRVDPVDTVAGVKARLACLGWFHGPIDDRVDDTYRAALCGYQVERELEPSGEADDATRRALVDDYGI